MGGSKKSEIVKKKTLIKGLNNLLNGLPSNSEKQEINKNFEELIAFFNTLRKNFNNVPSLEDMQEVKKNIDNIETILAQSETNPIIANALGIRLKSSLKSKPKITEEDINKAKNILKEIESLPVDKINSRLHDKNISLKEIRAISLELGIKSSDRLGKDKLIHQITNKIANYRGYKQLGGLG